MKKNFNIFLLIICIVLLGCVVLITNSFINNKESKNNINTDLVDQPLKLIDEVVDRYNNILQQIYYNEETGDYVLLEYTYTLQKNKWVCTDQRTTIIPNKNFSSPVEEQSDDSTLKIYYNSDLADGPITIMDNEYATISIVKYLAKDYWWEFGYELKVVNKTNQVLTVMIDNSSIMDIQCKPLFSIDHIEAHNTTYFTMAWDNETLERSYIPYIDNIEFMIRIYDNENWKTPALAGSKLLIKK